MNENVEPNRKPELEDTASVSPGSPGGDEEAQSVQLYSGSARPEDHPRQIGPFAILELLGEGGMGLVYLAEQTAPFRRRVALKVIKLGMDTREVVARFEGERQALALMNHPGIAKVFEAGATPDGRPYFVMEHVAGEPITSYCDRRSLTTKERLELFLNVCEAVQHAHQKAVIHRDLKASNVLVTEVHGKPVAKIIDFGIAKATDQKLTEKTVYTERGQLIGTPEYMSPEQACSGGHDVDTRTDIYSLGVLLYELLVGKLPFDGKTLRQAGYAGLQRIICEEEPQRPSARVAASAPDTDLLAKKRRTASRLLARDLRTDLDWIVMKALEKDRNRRYPSASELARDIERHMNAEPVLAGPPSVKYRLGKFVRRHRGPLAAVAILILTLSAGLASSLILYGEARRNYERSQRNEQQLAQANEYFQRKALKAKRVSQLLRDLPLKAGALAPGVDLGDMMEAMASQLRSFLPKLNDLFVDKPELIVAFGDFFGEFYVDKPMLASFGKAIIENSLEIEARIHGEKSPEAFHLRRMLCRVLATEGHLDEARKRAEGLLQSMAQVPGMSALDIAEGKVLLAELLLEGEEAGGDSGVAAEPPAQTSQAVEQLPAGRPGQLAATERVPPPNLSAAALLMMDACQIQRQMLGRSFPEIDDALLRLIPALEKRGEKDLAKRCRQVVDDKDAPETP